MTCRCMMTCAAYTVRDATCMQEFPGKKSKYRSASTQIRTMHPQHHSTAARLQQVRSRPLRRPLLHGVWQSCTLMHTNLYFRKHESYRLLCNLTPRECMCVTQPGIATNCCSHDSGAADLPGPPAPTDPETLVGWTRWMEVGSRLDSGSWCKRLLLLDDSLPGRQLEAITAVELDRKNRHAPNSAVLYAAGGSLWGPAAAALPAPHPEASGTACCAPYRTGRKR